MVTLAKPVACQLWLQKSWTVATLRIFDNSNVAASARTGYVLPTTPILFVPLHYRTYDTAAHLATDRTE